MIRKYILISGLVQGVGFRPFVYKIAMENDLKGFIKNSSIGVIIDVEGGEASIDSFIRELKENGPELLNIEKMIIEDKVVQSYKTFEIRESLKSSEGLTFISPDLGICRACYEDIKDKKNKRYRYPFTNCTNCGPRYSIIKILPYDRKCTTMSFFKMCKSCNEEYKNVLDRRFHAQPNCCPECGPKLELVDKFGDKVNTEDPIREAIKFIKEGKILSIKGIGGFHLVCDGKNEEVIKHLREKKHRPRKPFAIMLKDIETVKKYCIVSIEEEKLLTSNKSPIVLLERREDILPSNIAPNNKTLGIILPYTPLHYLLFDDDLEVLIMTSANLNSMPIIYENKQAIDNLFDIVDYCLIHDRYIYTAVDDSVTRVILGEERVIRLARGYAPTYLKGENFKESLSFGPCLKNNFCFCKDENIILSQYIGDLDNLETLNRYDKAMGNLLSIYNINPKLIVYDNHPSIFSNLYVDRFKGKMVGVYHHHAHIVSVLFENRIKDKVIGIVYDGSGYGEDGTIWGGEFLITNCREFKRVGHLNKVKMPGGDKAAIEPIRMAISYLYMLYKEDDSCISNTNILSLFNRSQAISKKEQLYIDMIKKDVNCPYTSSMGRLFDAVSYMLGFNKKSTFEGEAAIYLENISDVRINTSYDFDIQLINEKYIINTDKIIKGIIQDLKLQVAKHIISMKFHNTVIEFTVTLCSKLSQVYGIKKVALSGGVFQNKILLEGIYNILKKKNFEVYINKQIPCNDGGISLGQLVIANERELN